MFLRKMMDVPDLVANRDVCMVLLQKKIQNAKTPEEREQFEKQKFELHQVSMLQMLIIYHY